MTWYICTTCGAKVNDLCGERCDHSCPNGHSSLFDIDTLEKNLKEGKYYKIGSSIQ